MNLSEKIAGVFPDEGDIPEFCRLEHPVDQRKYLVNGELRQWTGPVQEVRSPVYIKTAGGLTQKVVGSYPLLGEEEALEALAAARQAYNHGHGLWPSLSVQDRINHMNDFIFRISAKKDEVVKILMWEIGKSLSDSAREFDRTVDYIRATIDALKDLDRTSSRFVMAEGIFGQIRRAPLGVVLCMGPFNYPLNETYTSVIPALIMGNTVIFKPPKLGVLLHYPFLNAFKEAFPPGVINTVYGRGSQVVGPLMATGQIDVLAFIGTSKVADTLKKQHPKSHRLRAALGLEAKNPAIILADADLDLTVAECLKGALSFNGQRCTALKLLLVQRQIAPQFLEKFSQALEHIKFGMPWEAAVAVTPLPEANRPDYLTELMEDAKAKGAQVVNDSGGTVNHSFFYPALLYPVDDRMKVFHEEQFGPLIPVAPFDDLDMAVESIIASDYGQQVSIFSSNADTIARLVDRLVTQVGRVNINSQCQRGPDTFPFTGRKDSAEGTLSVHDALRVFSLRTLVAANETELNKTVVTDIVRDHKSSFLSTDFIL
ncbi:MAG: NADP-dependent glyceraldehyde-3-phosphate dehydrogenase [Desulfobaccales bacterium]